ncbi:glycoside hydrolase family 5 protein [Laetiporus sulphureus 93-53]|uniref:Glycoside hydrolase family 5 protein n=1 Tax=Laetiporus sulphureus 93-53 TaxID=1314785 RepID=A0A165B9Z4_9APHY|nr:glycoside hydrolase family 5 protein [Laetiporus sulphureus 93-53]KZT00591.1 glycoside hydrolase family 5 protein [Laetiporus sulphureus 93-53]
MHALVGLAALLASSKYAFAGYLPDKIYGVNIGGWLVLEPWMLPAEWEGMGGQICDDCSQCIGSEWNYTKTYGQATANVEFTKHWSTWFTQEDVDTLVADGINTVRIPLGFWIVEQIVNRETEFYAEGGIVYLQSGLKMLSDAGIQVILDHHALPGVQTSDQSFTGNCTDNVQFYASPTAYNYERALIWTAVMTTLAHLDPNFNTVFAIEAVNEPIMDADETPGYGYFQKNFVDTVRAVELTLGITVPGMTLDTSITTTNFTAALGQVASATTIFNTNVTEALAAAAPILLELAMQLSIPAILDTSLALGITSRSTLWTTFMDVDWQYDDPPNPADAAIGPQGYDNHLYYSFGGVADANPTAYMESICNLDRVQADAVQGDTPLWFGEWGLPTQFDATDAFLYMWADAQKRAYTKGAGWIFWNFKVEQSELAGNLSRQWRVSYIEGVKLGYLTRNPADYHNASVCAPYIESS